MSSKPGLYLDACATTPLAQVAQVAMEAAAQNAWANPSSLHGFGLAAAESLERSRHSLASSLGTTADAVHVVSGASESVHLALLGAADCLPPGRLLISAVEHPAVVAAATRLQQQGWQLAKVPVDHTGLVDLEALTQLLAPPTRMVSVIGGQSEVGTIQPLEAIGQLCQQAGVLFHSDAVQLAPHQRLAFDALPLDMLSLSAHKLGGPRGVGALLLRPGLQLSSQIGGGGQERGLRGGTEPVVLAAGFAAALAAVVQAPGPGAPVQQWRDALLQALLQLPGVRLSGPDPALQARLPHHISLLLQRPDGRPLPGRAVVRALWRQGVAASSGSACGGNNPDTAASPVLLAMGFDPATAAAGLRLSLGPWVDAEALANVPMALAKAMELVAGA